MSDESNQLTDEGAEWAARSALARTQAESEEARRSLIRMKRQDELRAQAINLGSFGLLGLLLAGLTFIGAIIVAMFPEPSMLAISVLGSLSSFFLVGAVGCFILGQLVHIRAALEK